MFDAILAMVGFCIIGIVIGCLEGIDDVQQEKNIRKETMQNTRKKFSYRILVVFIEMIEFIMLLYITIFYREYMDIWIQLSLAVILVISLLKLLFVIKSVLGNKK